MSADRFNETLHRLESEGNLRSIPPHDLTDAVDLTSNDYLGIAADTEMAEAFYASASPADLLPTAVASRLLAATQTPYNRLESLLEDLYGRPALLFNSGYHANTGIIPAIASKGTLIVADRLVHASIIDGIRLSGTPFERFRHNDTEHLDRILAKNAGRYSEFIIIAESVYSMDGDSPDMEALLEIKRRHPGAMLYIDEAHAFGVCGPGGLGLAAASSAPDEFDIIVGTLGKAAASAGAFAVTTPTVKRYLTNRCRSLIFSTALPPVTVNWSRYVVERLAAMDSRRTRLKTLSDAVGKALGAENPTHIIPHIVGDARRTVEMSLRLAAEGVKVLPIRTPTVPPGTERLRISLSASVTDTQLKTILNAFSKI